MCWDLWKHTNKNPGSEQLFQVLHMWNPFGLKKSDKAKLTKVPDMPHGVNDGMTFVENNEEWRSGNTVCQCFTV